MRRYTTHQPDDLLLVADWQKRLAVYTWEETGLDRAKQNANSDQATVVRRPGGSESQDAPGQARDGHWAISANDTGPGGIVTYSAALA